MQAFQLLKRKIIRVTIKINDKNMQFVGKNGANKLTSDSLRVQCVLAYGAGNITPTAQISIYGLSIATMSPLMRIQWNTMSAVLNTIQIEVGEEGDKALSLAYEGNITFAKIDMSNSPTTCLQIESQMCVVDSLLPQDSKTYDKGQDGAEIIKQISEEMGYKFTNNGATHIIADALTLEGSRINRIQNIAHMCNFDLYTEQRSIAICPKGVAQEIKIPTISPSTGLIGYPSPDIRGVSFTCLYSPLVRFGGIVRIDDSLIPTCNGDWRVYGLTATLEANAPSSRWEMEVMASPRESKYVAVAK